MKQGLTNSRMQSFKACPQRHYFEYEQRIRPDRPTEPLFVGTLVHLGIELLDRGVSVDDVRTEIEERFGATLHKEDKLLVYYVVIAMITGYAWRWSGAAGECEVVASELKFEIPLRNPATGRASNTWEFRGRIDKIVRNNGGLSLYEIKTVGESIAPDSDYWRMLAIDEQISGYFLAARHCGYEIDKVIYDVLRKPEISPRNPTYQLAAEARRALMDAGTYFGADIPREEVELAVGRKQETPRMFGARFMADIYARPDFYFSRREIPRIESDLRSYEYDRWYTSQSIRRSQVDNQWPRFTRSCLRPYRCAHVEHCVAGIRHFDAPPSGFVQLKTPHPELE